MWNIENYYVLNCYITVRKLSKTAASPISTLFQGGRNHYSKGLNPQPPINFNHDMVITLEQTSNPKLTWLKAVVFKINSDDDDEIFWCKPLFWRRKSLTFMADWTSSKQNCLSLAEGSFAVMKGISSLEDEVAWLFSDLLEFFGKLVKNPFFSPPKHPSELFVNSEINFFSSVSLL